MKTAFIIGVSGQIGSYLAHRLQKQGYQVIGWTQQSLDSKRTHYPIEGAELPRDVESVDQKTLPDVLTEYQPDEVYCFYTPQRAFSYQEPLFTNFNARSGIVSILESIRDTKPDIKLCIASSNSITAGLSEAQCKTAAMPSSQYRLLSVYDQWALSHYRNYHSQNVFSSILMNPISPHQQPDLLARKITAAVVQIKLKIKHSIHLGNLEQRYIWAHPKDYASALQYTVQQQDPNDYLITVGESHTVREFVETAFDYFGIDWEAHVVEDRNLFHPLQVQQFTSGSTNPLRKLQWTSTVSFRDMIYTMIDADFQSEVRRSTSLFPFVNRFRGATANLY